MELEATAQLELVPEPIGTLRPRLRQGIAHLLPGQRADEGIVERVEHPEGRDLGRRGGWIEPARGDGDMPGDHDLSRRRLGRGSTGSWPATARPRSAGSAMPGATRASGVKRRRRAHPCAPPSPKGRRSGRWGELSASTRASQRASRRSLSPQSPSRPFFEQAIRCRSPRAQEVRRPGRRPGLTSARAAGRASPLAGRPCVRARARPHRRSGNGCRHRRASRHSPAPPGRSS